VSIIAYITNQFPSAVEPYVIDEIAALRERGVKIITASGQWVEPGSLSPSYRRLAEETIYLQPVTVVVFLQALTFLLCRFRRVSDLLARALKDREPIRRRVHAVAHTLLGAVFAVRIKDAGVEHIHVHHGYFSSWVAMTAARLLNIGFSMTLHGSDVLLHGAYLDVKLKNCDFCATVSEYNRHYLLAHYPRVPATKILLQRVGVECGGHLAKRAHHRRNGQIEMLAVGRLHPVKDFEFLVKACELLKERRIPFRCRIAGDGPERDKLEHAIRDVNLDDRVQLLGHIAPERLGEYYKGADLVVLTSRSEGIPLVLMEAMARGKLVLAPDITGIPELVRDWENGFLFRAGSLEDFVSRVDLINQAWPALSYVRRGARLTVSQSFNREKNLESFCNFLLHRVPAPARCAIDESPVLQQI
jgi:colanic acid/amylovoran biosynthesis glycosyltransferase